MPTLLVLATTGVLPADFRLFVALGEGLVAAERGLRLGAVRAFLLGVSGSS